jgi:hypothetical protein
VCRRARNPSEPVDEIGIAPGQIGLLWCLLRSGSNLRSVVADSSFAPLGPGIVARGWSTAHGCPLEFVIGLLADKGAETDTLSNCQGLVGDAIRACLADVRGTLRSEKVFFASVS